MIRANRMRVSCSWVRNSGRGGSLDPFGVCVLTVLALSALVPGSAHAQLQAPEVTDVLEDDGHALFLMAAFNYVEGDHEVIRQQYLLAASRLRHFEG